MAAYRILFCALVSLILPAPGIANEARPAQCLLEVKGTHHLGGRCILTPLDKAGSFSVMDAQGSGLTAKIQISGEDEGEASWNGPAAGKGGEQKLGAAARAKNCWLLDDAAPDQYNDSRVCFWELGESLYLGPSPKQPAAETILYYGSRVGMFYDIVARNNLDTSNAEITAKASHDGAVMFCREYSRDYSSQCIDAQVKSGGTRAVRGDCRNKTFQDFGGNRYSFHGKAGKNRRGAAAEYDIRTADGVMLDGSAASGYDLMLGVYQALCPRSAPRSSN